MPGMSSRRGVLAAAAIFLAAFFFVAFFFVAFLFAAFFLVTLFALISQTPQCKCPCATAPESAYTL